ncbi:hypothetical protein BDB01DRAFT_849264 [Pilobolus umbonatus]|nr:hypothetical protein BDB01DRAFT_849264 [Pilobolus umbonatus]
MKGNEVNQVGVLSSDLTDKLKRSNLEREFGEKLQKLYLSQETNQSTCRNGIPAALNAVSLELQNTADIHIQLATKLKEEVADEINMELEKYRAAIANWSQSLDELYNDRQKLTIELLKVRSKYIKEHEASQGKSNPTIESLKEHYQSLVTQLDALVKDWNDNWREICQTIEVLEEERVELIKNNVWGYANMLSDHLMIQDTCCEQIRTKLEECSVFEEIQRCITEYGTGSTVPTTNDYVSETIKMQKARQSSAVLSRARSYNQKKAKATQKDNVGVKGRVVTDEERLEDIKRRVSNNMDSTIIRGQVKRKPLNKSLMDEVSHQMAEARQRKDADVEPAGTLSTMPVSAVKPRADKNLDHLLKAFEDPSSEYTSDTPASTDTFSRNTYNKNYKRQTAEYKPDTGSIRIKNKSHDLVLKEIVDAPKQNLMSEMTASQAPKSPRPPPQKIITDNQSLQQLSNNNSSFNEPNYYPSYQQPPNHFDLPLDSTVVEHHQTYNNQTPPSAHTYGHQQHCMPQFSQPYYVKNGGQQMAQPPRSPMMQPQKSPMMKPHRSPMMQPHRSPMMQPQRSPMIQPQRSPMMQPQRSPMMQPQMQPQRSPMIQPQMQPPRSPMMQSQMQPPRSPMMQPPRSPMIPPSQQISPSQHSPMASSQRSTSMMTTNSAYDGYSVNTFSKGTSSGILPSPNMSYNSFRQPKSRPTYYNDERPIQFWARAKYDYNSTDSSEIPFRAGDLIGVLESDLTKHTWWQGAVYDEYHRVWSNAGSVPSNFMAEP